MIRVYIDPRFPFEKMLKHVFQLIADNKEAGIEFAEDEGSAQIKITSGDDTDFFVAKNFYEDLSERKIAQETVFADSCVVTDAKGREDLLSTIFYCVNSIQEYHQDSGDELGRFEFKTSYQHRFGNIDKNYAQDLIDRVCEHPKLAMLKSKRRKSKIFLTHDIDSIHGAWKEDGFYALKNLRPGKMFSLMLNEALGKPDWLNMDRMMKIEDEKGFTSTFYWLLYKDKKNADYRYKHSSVQKFVKKIENSKWENGLHKSLHNTTFAEELNELGLPAAGNRFHYLNFTVPDGYKKIEDSGLKLDTSLGFSEQWGFRNSYGLPFMPFHAEENRKMDFIEVPMQVMDRTFFSRRIPVAEIKRILLDLFDRNRNDCVFSINFHNNFFSGLKYGGYTELYKALLAYFRDAGWEPVTQKELIKEFYKSGHTRSNRTI